MHDIRHSGVENDRAQWEWKKVSTKTYHVILTPEFEFNHFPPSISPDGYFVKLLRGLILAVFYET
jgi:hypothetical protein